MTRLRWAGPPLQGKFGAELALGSQVTDARRLTD